MAIGKARCVRDASGSPKLPFREIASENSSGKYRIDKSASSGKAEFNAGGAEGSKRNRERASERASEREIGVIDRSNKHNHNRNMM